MSTAPVVPAPVVGGGTRVNDPGEGPAERAQRTALGASGQYDRTNLGHGDALAWDDEDFDPFRLDSWPIAPIHPDLADGLPY